MKMTNIVKLICSIAIATASVATLAAYPDKPIKMIVPYAAGGGADNTARAVSQKFGDLLGQPIIIDNKPGAGGVIGADMVAKSAPDGYTILWDASAYAVNPALRKMPFDADSDLIPVSLISTASQILVTSPNSPFNNVKELIAYAKKNPGTLTIASAGSATGSHLAAEAFKEKAGIDILHIPYKGGAPALTDVMGGQVTLYFGNAASTQNYVVTGKLKALAVSSKKRLAALPNVPTLSESGMKDFEVLEWNGVFVPKGTPQDIVNRVAKDLQMAVNDPVVNEQLKKMGLEPIGSTPANFSAFLKSESKRWQALVRALNIKVD
jgi:tripartite-type tricarboxylate transporter receptor subunit TctC